MDGARFLARVLAGVRRRVRFGGAPFRLLDLDGQIIAHAAACPRWLVPREAAR